MPYLRLCRRDVPVVINVSINEYLVCKPYRKLTSRTPHVENLDIYGVVFLVRKPNRREMYPVVVGRVFILFENKAAARFFKQAVVKCGAVAVVVEFREQHICGLASGAVLRISGEVGANAYLYSIAARAVDTTVSSSIPSSGAKVFAARSYTPYVRSPSQTTSNGAVRPSAAAPPQLLRSILASCVHAANFSSPFWSKIDTSMKRYLTSSSCFLPVDLVRGTHLL